MNPFFPERPEHPRRKNPSPIDKQNKLRQFQPLARYQVILLGDPQQDLMLIIRSVMELTRFPRAEATHKMWQAHHTGRSIVLATHFERAELYAEQFAERGVRVTIERA